MLATPLVPRLWDRLLAERGRSHWDAYAALGAEYLDSMQGMATLKSLNAAPGRRQLLRDKADHLFRSTMRQLAVSMPRASSPKEPVWSWPKLSAGRWMPATRDDRRECARILYMQMLPLAQVRARLSELVDTIDRTAERVLITRNGVPAAVVISVDDLAAMEETLAWLDGDATVRRAQEADEAVDAGEVTGRDEMAAILAARARHSA